MLDRCLQYYGLDSHIYITRALQILEEQTNYLYPNGYKSFPKNICSLTHSHLAEQFGLRYSAYNHHIINEIFRYAALFGLITDVCVYPNHIDWVYNPMHKRDIFFAHLKFTNRYTTTQTI